RARCGGMSMPPVIDTGALAPELQDAYAPKRVLDPPPSPEGGLGLAAAPAGEWGVGRLRPPAGPPTVGRRVGYANKAAWRVLKLETLVWAHMYDDTVRYASGGAASLALGSMYAPRIEPEIVFKMKAPLGPGAADAAAVLESVEWLALG